MMIDDASVDFITNFAFKKYFIVFCAKTGAICLPTQLWIAFGQLQPQGNPKNQFHKGTHSTEIF